MSLWPHVSSSHPFSLCARTGPILSARARTRNPGLRSPRLFLGGLARLVVPGHLAPFYRRIAATYTYTLSVLSSCHVLIFFGLFARISLNLSFPCLPLWGVCVCVCACVCV